MTHDRVDQILAEWARERPDVDASPIGVIGRISRAARYLERELETTFRELGLDNGTYDVLATLRRSGAPFELSASALADATMIARSSMTSRIDRLERAGHVTRVDDEQDGRGVGVRLTRSGFGLIERATVDHLANEARLLSGLPEGTATRLASDLRELLSTLESRAPGARATS
jgi:DNA-binding MarR family transcriptional regulator